MIIWTLMIRAYANDELSVTTTVVVSAAATQSVNTGHLKTAFLQYHQTVVSVTTVAVFFFA